jgi:hypothetical protein
MRSHVANFVWIVALSAALMTADSAWAISADIAKKCNALTAKNYPPREPGNPAAGSAKGSGADQKAFFDKCVSNGGKADPPSESK